MDNRPAGLEVSRNLLSVDDPWTLDWYLVIRANKETQWDTGHVTADLIFSKALI